MLAGEGLYGQERESRACTELIAQYTNILLEKVLLVLITAVCAWCQNTAGFRMVSECLLLPKHRQIQEVIGVSVNINYKVMDLQNPALGLGHGEGGNVP